MSRQNEMGAERSHISATLALVAAAAWSALALTATPQPAHAQTCTALGGNTFQIPGQAAQLDLDVNCVGAANGATATVVGTVTNNGSTVIRDAGGGVQNWTVNVNPGVTVQRLDMGTVIISNSPGFAVNNSGAVISTNGTTLDLNAGGTVNNLVGATITANGGNDGVNMGGLGTVMNAGTITALRGVVLNGGGTVTNLAGAMITGTEDGVETFNVPVTVTNGGSIRGGLFGVELGNGGTVTNQAGGTIASDTFDAVRVNMAMGTVTNGGMIRGNQDGIDLDQGGTVINQLGGMIIGVTDEGIEIDNAAGTVDNAGTITGRNEAVRLDAGGTLINRAGGVITSTDDNGVEVQNGTGTVDNHGTINGNLAAILLFQDGTVTNRAGATITSDEEGVVAVNNPITVTNGGGIQGRTFGIDLNGGGTVVNQVGASVVGTTQDGIEVAGGVGTVISAGTITGGSGIAINFVDAGFDDVVELQPGFVMNGNVLANTGNDTLRFNGNGVPGNFNLDNIDDGPMTAQFRSFEIFQVNGGTWSFSGEANVPFTVNGGTLGGNFTVGGLTVNTGATVAPGASIGTINVNGNVAFNAGSTLAVEIDAAGNADRINATGTAMIAPGTTLNISGTPSTATYTFLTAGGGITGQFTNIVDNIPDLDFATTYSATTGQFTAIPATDGNTSRKEIHPTSMAAGMDAARLFGQTLRRRGGLHAGGLTYIVGSTVEALGYMPGSDAPKSLPPHVLAADAPDLPVEQAFAPKRWGVWAAAMGGLSDTDNDGAIPGWDAQSGGLAIGAEHYFQGTGIPVMVGLAGGYSTSDVDSAASNADVASWHGGVYAATEAGALTVSGAIAYAWQDYDMSRPITVGGATVRANGDADGSSLTASAEAFLDAARFATPLSGSGFGLGPIATLDAVFAERDGFTETGAGLLNLTVGSDDANQAITGLGLAATVSQMVNGMRLTGDARVVWEHVFGDDHVTSGSAIPAVAGATFTTRSAAIDRDRLAAGIGAALDFSEMVSMHARYDGAFSSSTTDHRGAAGVTVRF